MRPAAWGGWLPRFALPLLLLNALLTMENHGPGLWPRLALRVSFELVMVLVMLTAWIAWRGQPGARMLRLLASVTAFWILARYLDVTVSAVFGRQINLYWDSRHALDVLRMGELAAWQIGLAALAALAIPVLLYGLAWRCWLAIARELAWPTPRPAIGLIGLLLFANFAAHGIGGATRAGSSRCRSRPFLRSRPQSWPASCCPATRLRSSRPARPSSTARSQASAAPTCC